MTNFVRKPLAVLTSTALAATLLLTPAVGPVSAETTDTAAAINVTFPDVGPGHWARSHVAKLAAGGIVRGYENGQFQPSSNVSQQEAIVMAIRMIGLEDEALADSRTVVLGFEVDSFFRPYVVKALEARILNLAEETEAAASVTPDVPWGKRPATREWVAKIVVRAIGQSGSLSNDADLSFEDADEVSTAGEAFVEKAVELGLVTGFTDNTFRPKDPVTRAQIATFLSRADEYAPQRETTMEGIVINRTDGTIQVQAGNGSVQSFTLNESTLAFDTSGQAMSTASITEMQRIKLVAQNNTAYYVELTGEQVQLDTIQGDVLELDLTAMEITLASGSGTATYELAPNTMATDAQGSGISLSAITEGSAVRLQRIPGTDEISSIIVEELAYNATGTAEAVLVDAAKRELTYRDEATGQLQTYPVASGAELSIRGAASDSLADIGVGDTISYEIRNGAIVAVDVTVPKYETVTGELFSFGDDSITVLGQNGELIANFLANGARIEITGMDRPTVDDLQKGDQVQLRINGTNSRIERVLVLDRNINLYQAVTILHFDTEKDYITVQLEDGTPALYQIKSRTELLIDGEELDLEDDEEYLQQGRVVNLTVSDNQLIELEVITKAEGKVTALNTSARTITIQSDNGEKATYSYSSSTDVEMQGVTNASIDNLMIGSAVKLTLDSNDQRVDEITVNQSFVYRLQAIDDRKLTLASGTGAVSTVTLTSRVSILDESNRSVLSSALVVGEPILVNYDGRSIESVQKASPVRGRVSALDGVGGSLTITDFNGNVREYDVDSGVTVITASGRTGSLSSIKVNDRVQVVSDAQGNETVWLASGMERAFSRYDGQKNEISFKISTLSEQSTYGFHSYAYIHTASGGVVTLSRLKENERLTVYVLDGKIMELIQ